MNGSRNFKGMAQLNIYEILDPDSTSGELCWAKPNPAGVMLATHGMKFASSEELRKALGNHPAFSNRGEKGGGHFDHDGILFITEPNGTKWYRYVYFKDSETSWTIYEGKAYHKYRMELHGEDPTKHLPEPTPLFEPLIEEPIAA